MSDPIPSSDGPKDITLSPDIPRMTIDQARIVMDGLINIDPRGFTDAESLRKFSGFTDAFLTLSEYIYAHSEDVIESGMSREIPDYFMMYRTAGDQKYGLSIKTTKAIGEQMSRTKDKQEKIRIMNQNTPMDISVSTDDIPPQNGFNTFGFSIQLQSQFPGERQEHIFVNFIKENKEANGGIYYPPISKYQKELTAESFKTIARGIGRCAKIISDWDKAIQPKPPAGLLS